MSPCCDVPHPPADVAAAALPVPVFASPTVAAGRRSWDGCAGCDFAFERRERGPHSGGPARGVLEGPVTVVVGTTTHAAALAPALLSTAQYLANAVYMAEDTRALLLNDTEVVADPSLVRGRRAMDHAWTTLPSNKVARAMEGHCGRAAQRSATA